MTVQDAPLRERKRRETWRLIHGTALRLMHERGFDAVSIDDIVAASGISRRTFFNYFAGKEAVVFDPDPDDPALWQRLMAARPTGEDLWSTLREVLIGYTAATAERLTVQHRVRLASPGLDTCSRAVCDRFFAAVRQQVIPERTHPDLRLDLAVAAARTVLGTACLRWDADRGIAALHHEIRAGFDVLGAGLTNPRVERTTR
jgi:AcrR family transcriptional regulator